MATETIDTEIVCPIVTAEAKIIPITAARTAFMAAFTRVDWFSVLTKRDNNTVKTIGGVNMAMVANNAPMIPATLYPMKVAVMNMGRVLFARLRFHLQILLRSANLNSPRIIHAEPE